MVVVVAMLEVTYKVRAESARGTAVLPRRPHQRRAGAAVAWGHAMTRSQPARREQQPRLTRLQVMALAPGERRRLEREVSSRDRTRLACQRGGRGEGCQGEPVAAHGVRAALVHDVVAGTADHL